jgi:hypothetical protein
MLFTICGVPGISVRFVVLLAGGPHVTVTGNCSGGKGTGVTVTVLIR